MRLFRKSISSIALVPSITLSIPFPRTSLIVSERLIPPPYCIFISIFFFILNATLRFSGFPVLAPSRSIICSHSAPSIFHFSATSTGLSKYFFWVLNFPLVNLTQAPLIKSIAGIIVTVFFPLLYSKNFPGVLIHRHCFFQGETENHKYYHILYLQLFRCHSLWYCL